MSYESNILRSDVESFLGRPIGRFGPFGGAWAFSILNTWLYE